MNIKFEYLNPLGKSNLIFCCTGSPENYFGLVSGSEHVAIKMLIKMAAEPFSTSFSISISYSFKCNVFPSNARVACVKP